MKIAVYAIAKNEEKFVERFCESAKEADYIIIADTGSTDNTKAIAEANNATVYDIGIYPWRFDKARDAALALVPSDVTICVSLDIDEVLEPGWREEILSHWTEKTTRLRYKYEWCPGNTFYYDKIHHRHGYFWRHPCHEVPVADNRITEVYMQTDKQLVTHKPDPSKPRSQYLGLLKLSVEEDPADPRNAFYYARELTFNFLWEEAKEHLQHFLDMPEATWVHERIYAMRLLSKCYVRTNDRNEGIDQLRIACREAPYIREPWVDLAQLMYEDENWNACWHCCSSALQVAEPEPVYTTDPAVWGIKVYDIGSIAAWELGFTDQAIELVETALELQPNITRLQDNLDIFLNQDESLDEETDK